MLFLRFLLVRAPSYFSNFGRCERHARFALMENEHRPCAITNTAALGSGVDILGPFVDGGVILDGILRRSSIGADGGVCDGA
jgi:hypothetical protein